MALTSFALRLALRKSLTGATLAGSNVFDTAGLITETGRDEPQLSIVVDVNHTVGRAAVVALTLALHGRDLAVSDDGQSLHPVWSLAPSTAATERVLDILAHQVGRVLKSSAGDWPTVLRALAVIGGTREERGEPGAAQRIIVIDLECEPEPSGAPGPKWQMLLDEVDAAGADLAGDRLVLDAMLGGASIELAGLGLPAGVPFADAYPKSEAKAKPGRKARR